MLKNFRGDKVTDALVKNILILFGRGKFLDLVVNWIEKVVICIVSAVISKV